MTINEVLQKRFMERLVSTPRGRAHVLALCAEGEANGEGQVFDRALAKVDDPEIARLIKRHAEDEIRHAQMFEEAAARQNAKAGPFPSNIKLVDRLDAALGGLLDRPIERREDVMHMYLILQVIEERAITQFRVMEPLFRKVDPKSADVFAAVARDEERHLKYCHAIAKKFAPDEATRERELARYRAVEQQVFGDTSRDNM